MKIYLDHIGIACENLDDSSSFWSLLGLIQGDDELVEDQGVTTRFFRQVKTTLQHLKSSCSNLQVKIRQLENSYQSEDLVFNKFVLELKILNQ